MGIMDFIKKYTEKKDKDKLVKDVFDELNKAEASSNYREGVIKAFNVIERLGTVYLDIKREPAVTVREYVRLLEEDGIIRKDEFKSLVHTYEIARYSPEEPSMSDFTECKNLVMQFKERVKSPRKAKKTTKKPKKGRRRPTRSGGGSGERARPRRRRRQANR